MTKDKEFYNFLTVLALGCRFLNLQTEKMEASPATSHFIKSVSPNPFGQDGPQRPRKAENCSWGHQPFGDASRYVLTVLGKQWLLGLSLPLLGFLPVLSAPSKARCLP